MIINVQTFHHSLHETESLPVKVDLTFYKTSGAIKRQVWFYTKIKIQLWGKNKLSTKKLYCKYGAKCYNQ